MADQARSPWRGHRNQGRRERAIGNHPPAVPDYDDSGWEPPIA
jgi:hypothetical protein